MDMTIETDRQRLERALDADPTDWGLRLLLADVLEEAGEDVAAWGQRWQATAGKSPLDNPTLRPEGVVWSWWRVAPPWGAYFRYFRLPPPPFDLMQEGRHTGAWTHGVWRSYTTRAAAEADLARALSLLPDRGASFLPAAVECRQSPGRRTCLT